MAKTNQNFDDVWRIREHLAGLMRVPPNDNSNNSNNNNNNLGVCSLCCESKLVLLAVPRYCSCCDKLIKCGVNYYYYCSDAKKATMTHNFCSSCVNMARRRISTFTGQLFDKSLLSKAMNAQEIQESWVQCETCGESHHEICGLHNRYIQESYKCPKCHLTENNFNLFPKAEDLPQTLLGNFIQQRLSNQMRQYAVPGLVVRVVLSSKKTLPVNERLLNVLKHSHHYPNEFPYTAKMILVFQRVEGIDVCLFAMFVQEYGSDCKGPNHRYACISYIDSAKYFSPNLTTSSGEALRTVAYHEILISYLAYAKKRGFARCYLWSCPPPKGEQYILNCHPQNQKTPNPERLRQWYLKMAKKAAIEGIVVNQTTLYERFFVPTESQNCKITAARLPYFEGDFWPRLVDNALIAIDKKDEELAKKGFKKSVTKTSMKVLGITKSYDKANKDVQLMQKLGYEILPLKENFIVLDLQHSCADCRDPILSGNRYLKRERTRNSYICHRCRDMYYKGNYRSLSEYEVVDDVPLEIEDEDEIIDNEICDNRFKFLRFCQERHYQFDTLRRSKHASMMILYHIHPDTRAKTALLAEKEIDCSHSVTIPSDEQSEMVQESELVEILNHVSNCPLENSDTCDFVNCKLMKSMFCHASECKIQASNGCHVCMKVWYILKSHSHQCYDQNCHIPYCKQLKM